MKDYKKLAAAILNPPKEKVEMKESPNSVAANAQYIGKGVTEPKGIFESLFGPQSPIGSPVKNLSNIFIPAAASLSTEEEKPGSAVQQELEAMRTITAKEREEKPITTATKQGLAGLFSPVTVPYEALVPKEIDPMQAYMKLIDPIVAKETEQDSDILSTGKTLYNTALQILPIIAGAKGVQKGAELLQPKAKEIAKSPEPSKKIVEKSKEILQQKEPIQEGNLLGNLPKTPTEVPKIAENIIKEELPPQAPVVSDIPSTPTIQNTPQKLTPIGTGETVTSKLASKVEENAILKKLVTEIGDLPQYNRVNLAEQARMASDIIKESPERALMIALGKETAPPHMLPEAIFTAVENSAIKRGDVETIKRLASESSLSTEATAMGQRIRALAERDQNSPVGIIQSVKKSREESVQKRVKVERAKKEAIQSINRSIQAAKSKRPSWEQFVKDISCNI